MRSGELLLLLLLLPPVGLQLAGRGYPGWRSRWRASVWSAAAVAVTAVHIWKEGPRWQMTGLYLLMAAAMIRPIRGRDPTGARKKGAARKVWLLAALAISASLPVLLPVPKLERPDGPYAVGTKTFWWKDDSRKSADGKGPRELMVQLFYPSEARKGLAQAPYAPGLRAIAAKLAPDVPLAGKLAGYVNLADTWTYEEAAVAPGDTQYPVVVLSHGWPGFRFTYHYLEAGLASRGYVVAAVDHTGGASAVVFPDGRVALQDPAPAEADLPAWNRLLDTDWQQDVRFVADKLAGLAVGNGAGDDAVGRPISLRGRLDLTRLGVIGHSFGGDNTLNVLSLDERFRTGVDLDGAFYGSLPVNLRPGQTFLWLSTEESVERLGLPQEEQAMQEGVPLASFREELRKSEERRDAALASPGAEHQVIPGAVHSSFSDVILFSPVIRLMKHAPDPARTHREILNRVEDWLRRTLY